MAVADQQRRHRAVDLLDGDGHQQVIAPCAVDFEIAPQQPSSRKPAFASTARLAAFSGRTRVASRRCSLTGAERVVHRRAPAPRSRHHRPCATWPPSSRSTPTPQRPVCHVADRQLAAELTVDLDHVRQHPPLAGLRPQTRAHRRPLRNRMPHIPIDVGARLPRLQVRAVGQPDAAPHARCRAAAPAAAPTTPPGPRSGPTDIGQPGWAGTNATGSRRDRRSPALREEGDVDDLAGGPLRAGPLYHHQTVRLGQRREQTPTTHPGAPPSACTRFAVHRDHVPRRYPLRPATDVIGDSARACTTRRIGCRLPNDSPTSTRPHHHLEHHSA